MDFRSLSEGLDLPKGASARYRTLEALERMLDGTLYEDLRYSFTTESTASRKYIPLDERRPSHDFCLAYEITQDTLAELFGDEQFPTVRVMGDDTQDDDATKALADLVAAVRLDTIMAEIYENGVIGAVGVIVHKSDDGSPYFEVCPAKWCLPVYRSPYSNELIGLTVTYPITKEEVRESKEFAHILDEPENKGVDVFWYRRSVDPNAMIEYLPLADKLFAKLGETNDKGETIAFVTHKTMDHGFRGRVPAVYTKNLSGKQRSIDGPCLWWPVRNMCIQIDYALSEAGRGLRYAADPMLFLKKTGLAAIADDDGLSIGDELRNENRDFVLGSSVQHDDKGNAVRGVAQTIVGEDAKMLEISASGIKEKREFVKDMREYVLEIVGGMKARAEHMRGAASGTAIDKGLKPLRRLVRRQRRPYGDNTLLALLDLTVYGFECGALDGSAVADDVDLSKIPPDPRMILDWPNDETLQGAELYSHVEGIQLAAGGSLMSPKELISPEAAGAKLAADMGFKEPYDTIKGSGDSQQVADAPALAAAAPKPAPIVKP